ncbi:MAG: hypothetical protein Q4E99_03810, partial [Bacillota bacterium]|nr:hypothetical protein [Bacillota bacterium]
MGTAFCFAANAGLNLNLPSPEQGEAQIVPQVVIHPISQELGTYGAIFVDIVEGQDVVIDGVVIPRVVLTRHKDRYRILANVITERTKDEIRRGLEEAFLEAQKIEAGVDLSALLTQRAQTRYGAGYDYSIFVARDIFDISLLDGYGNRLTYEDHYAKVIVDVGLQPDEEKPVVVH